MDYALKYKELRKNKGLSQEEFAILSGTSRSIISQIEIGKLKPSLENIASVVRNLKIPYAYFFEDDIGLNVHLNVHPNVHLIDQKEQLTVNDSLNEAGESYARRGNVLLVPVKAQAGYLAGYGDPEYIERLEYYNIPGCTHGSYRMFEVEGDSMYPGLRDGDYAIGRAITDCCQVKSGTIYIIVCREEGIVIKRVLNAPKYQGNLILNSDNENQVLYPPLIVQGPGILECWELYKIVTGPSVREDPVTSRLDKIEKEWAEFRRTFRKK
jgi:transcriptional regulator with XRE-family HTH domain